MANLQPSAPDLAVVSTPDLATSPPVSVAPKFQKARIEIRTADTGDLVRFYDFVPLVDAAVFDAASPAQAGYVTSDAKTLDSFVQDCMAIDGLDGKNLVATAVPM